jgi:hypothetical protein
MHLKSNTVEIVSILRKLSFSLLALTLWHVTAPLHAQEAQLSPLKSLLVRLGAQAAALEQSLPSFGCEETAISQELRKEKVIRRVDFTALLRVRRSPDGTLNESTEYATINGKPFTGGGFTMPAFSEGGFRHALGYFSPDKQSCFTYTLKPARIDFESAPGSSLRPFCRSSGTRGFALLDADGNITHVERHVTPEGSAAFHLSPYAAIDVAPVTLNGITYQLSRHLVSERPNGKSVDRFDADYTDCRLYTASITIGPTTELPDNSAPN